MNEDIEGKWVEFNCKAGECSPYSYSIGYDPVSSDVEFPLVPMEMFDSIKVNKPQTGCEVYVGTGTMALMGKLFRDDFIEAQKNKLIDLPIIPWGPLMKSLVSLPQEEEVRSADGLLNYIEEANIMPYYPKLKNGTMIPHLHKFQGVQGRQGLQGLQGFQGTPGFQGQTGYVSANKNTGFISSNTYGGVTDSYYEGEAIRLNHIITQLTQWRLLFAEGRVTKEDVNRLFKFLSSLSPLPIQLQNALLAGGYSTWEKYIQHANTLGVSYQPVKYVKAYINGMFLGYLQLYNKDLKILLNKKEADKYKGKQMDDLFPYYGDMNAEDIMSKAEIRALKHKLQRNECPEGMSIKDLTGSCQVKPSLLRSAVDLKTDPEYAERMWIRENIITKGCDYEKIYRYLVTNPEYFHLVNCDPNAAFYIKAVDSTDPVERLWRFVVFVAKFKEFFISKGDNGYKDFNVPYWKDFFTRETFPLLIGIEEYGMPLRIITDDFMTFYTEEYKFQYTLDELHKFVTEQYKHWWYRLWHRISKEI